MARKKVTYPMGSISSGTMRPEDLIPTFCAELYHDAKVTKANGHYRTIGDVPAKQRKQHLELVRQVERRMEADDYYGSELSEFDLESLFDALECYAGPYFYFGSHPGDGSDYGFWLMEDWDQDFTIPAKWMASHESATQDHIKVSDLAEIPAKYRGEVAVVNDHGNVTLYVKTSRTLREIWAVV